ncbi:hypothetical protein RN001_014908 [Aquatica leii]|uniref:Uncharacterized protein n=1 Tax=Aquatica leii TaxID=1421715 RepID=A0AAN7SBY5_9COLE|nr:hypothetical protein RN001_014908 [Aquatica leii]
MSVKMRIVNVVLLCLLQTCVSDEFFDNVNCGREQSDSFLAKSPWLAAVIVLDTTYGLFYTKCAGSLINQKYVLTTANCLSFDNKTRLQGVQLDITYIQNFTVTATLGPGVLKTYYGFENIIIHPEYDFKTGVNDIALLRLNRLVHYGRFTQPVCLPFQETAHGDTFYTGTWGKIFFSSFPIEKSNIASSAIVTSRNQIKTVENANNTDKLCKGHIGAPLMFTKDNQYYLQGLLVKKVECDSNSPGEYLNLVGYFKWIKETVTSNYNQCVTPDNEKRTCVTLSNCPLLLKAFANPKKEYEDHLYKYLCSDDRVGGFQVCCPSSLNASFYFDGETNLDTLSDKRFCGYQHRDDYLSLDEHIALDEFPWLATIRAVGRNNTEFSLCSGSLINARYVLTSAYCLMRQWEITVVRLGEFNILNKTDCVELTQFNEQDCVESIDYEIEEVDMHPFYNFWTYNNDIALIRLKNRVTFSDYIRPICLPTPKFKRPEINDTLYTTSFTSPKPWGTYYLKKKLFYTLVHNDRCQYKQTVNEYNMCLRPLAKIIDPYFSCFDDDGAPAMIAYKNQWTLEGITTERVSFCDISQPIILTKISSYLHWIQDNIRN